jgi:hypothetical protein
MLGISTAMYGKNVHPNNALTGHNPSMPSPNAWHRQLILHTLLALVHTMFNIVKGTKNSKPLSPWAAARI